MMLTEYMTTFFRNGWQVLISIFEGGLNNKSLDVLHIGLAFWKEEKLHLLHDSSVAKKIIEDP